jgi:hypothetical protein
MSYRLVGSPLALCVEQTTSAGASSENRRIHILHIHKHTHSWFID